MNFLFWFQENSNQFFILKLAEALKRMGNL